jgi:uncharacterized protein YybS (DUF2232 family)
VDDLIPELTERPAESDAPRADPAPPLTAAPSLLAASVPADPALTSHATPPARPAWVDAAALAEGGLLTDVGIILDLATIYLPLISPILAPAVPTPFAILMLRRGTRATLLAAAVATFLVSILAGPHFGWRMGLEVLVGLLLGWAMRRRWSWPTVLGAGTALVATVGFCAALGLIILTGLPVHDLVQMLRNGLTTLANFAAWLAQLTGQQALWLSMRPDLAAIGTFLVAYWPLLFYLYGVCVTVPTISLYYAVANITARVLGFQVKLFPPRSWLIILRVFGFLLLAPILLPARAWALLRRPARRRGRPAPATKGAPKP